MVFTQDIIDVDKEKYLRKREGYKYPNVIKINTLAIPFNNISLSYERGVLPRFSIEIGVGYKYKGLLPNVFAIEGAIIDARLDEIKGYSIAPEFRYYLKTCEHRLLEGFYASLYFKYAHYKTAAHFDYFPDGLAQEFYKSTIIMGEYGIGIQLGYQLVLWQRLNIDFMFFGPRFSKYHLTYEFDKHVSDEFLNDLTDHLNEIIDRFGLDYEVELKQSGKTDASHSFSFANIRFGISLGFAF